MAHKKLAFKLMCPSCGPTRPNSERPVCKETIPSELICYCCNTKCIQQSANTQTPRSTELPLTHEYKPSRRRYNGATCVSYVYVTPCSLVHLEKPTVSISKAEEPSDCHPANFLLDLIVDSQNGSDICLRKVGGLLLNCTSPNRRKECIFQSKYMQVSKFVPAIN